jgi:hypothetical protein
MSSVGALAFAAAMIFADFRGAFFPRNAFGPPADFSFGVASLLLFERGFLDVSISSRAPQRAA